MKEKLKKAKIIFVVGQAWLRKGHPVREDCTEIWLYPPLYWGPASGRSQLWIGEGQEAVGYHGEGRASASGE